MPPDPDSPLIFILAGEPSGDILGGRLMAALKTKTGGRIRFAGIGGDHMEEQGLNSLFPMSDLSVMGLTEVLPHLPKLLRRLRETAPGEAKGQELVGQELFDRFCSDMDGNFREMGVGDLTVPKRMLQVAEAFYGRSAAYDQALDGGDAAALEGALGRNVFGAGEALGARRLATYMRQAATELSAQDGAARGELRFPDPETIVAEPSQGARHP